MIDFFLTSAKLFVGLLTCCVILGCILRPCALLISIFAFPAYLGIFYAQDLPGLRDLKFFRVRTPKRRSIKVMMDCCGAMATAGMVPVAASLSRPLRPLFQFPIDMYLGVPPMLSPHFMSPPGIPEPNIAQVMSEMSDFTAVTVVVAVAGICAISHFAEHDGSEGRGWDGLLSYLSPDLLRKWMG